VLLDEDGDGGASRGDRPVVGAGVRLSGPISASTATGGDGSFAFGGLPAGAYTVSAGGAARVVNVDGRSSARADIFLTRGAVGGAAPPAPVAQPTPEPTPTAKPLPTPIVAPGQPTPVPPDASANGSSNASGSGSVSRPAPGYRPNTGSSASPGAPGASRPPLVSSGVRYAPGLGSPSGLKIVRSERALWLGVPFITQLDGTVYGGVNCGPASTAMVLGAFGIRTTPDAVRNYVNDATGVYSASVGTSLDSLARVARESGLDVANLHASGGYLRWSTDLLRREIESGRPVVTLVKYRALPPHSGSSADFDHYIVIAGLSGNDFIYNDAAFTGERGFGLLISPQDLERAWDYSSIPRHGMSVGLTAESLAQRKARIAPTGDAALDGGLDLGAELSDEELLAELDVSLGEELWLTEFDSLSWQRVDVENQAAPTPQPRTDPRPEARQPGATSESGLDLSSFAIVEPGAAVAGGRGQGVSLQPVAARTGGLHIPVPLVWIGFGLAIVVVGVVTRRMLE
jgi:hypothetical protein